MLVAEINARHGKSNTMTLASGDTRDVICRICNLSLSLAEESKDDTSYRGGDAAFASQYWGTVVYVGHGSGERRFGRHTPAPAPAPAPAASG